MTMTNREIDKKIAEELMGWKINNEKDPMWYNPDAMHPSDKGFIFRPITDFSPTELIQNAFMVVEKMNYLQFTLRRENCSGVRYDASFYNKLDTKDRVHANADTAPMAICLAALETLKDKKEVKRDGKETT